MLEVGQIPLRGLDVSARCERPTDVLDPFTQPGVDERG